MRHKECDVWSYTVGLCHLITSSVTNVICNPQQIITSPVWVQKTSMTAPDLHFTFDNLDCIDNHGGTLVQGKVKTRGGGGFSLYAVYADVSL